MWYGEYYHTLDEKDRFILPAKFREKIRALKRKKFFITRGLDGCLFLFHEEVWQMLEDRLKNLSFTKQEARFFNRLYFSGAQEVDIESQGRVTIPLYLKEFARINREVVIIGVSDRIEIWDKEEWSKVCLENQKRFEQVAEKLFE